MKAAVYRKYGSPDVLELGTVEKPAIGDNDVLIRVRATSVTSADCRLRSFNVPSGFWLPGRLALGVFRPRITVLGSELAGEVVSVGKDVTRFKTGDQVFGGDGKLRCHAEYKSMSEDGPLAIKPANLTFAEAAAVAFGGNTALVFLRDRGKIRSGEKVLIIGASGSVGTAAVQLAKHFGAEVTGVCSAANLDLVKSIGADKAIDYTKEDFAENGETYDVILDTVGAASIAHSKDSLGKGGRLLLVVAGLGPTVFAPLWTAITRSKRVFAGPAAYSAENVRFLAELIQAGQFKPVIDRHYPLEQIAEAHAYVDSGRKKGNVVITLGI